MIGFIGGRNTEKSTKGKCHVNKMKSKIATEVFKKQTINANEKCKFWFKNLNYFKIYKFIKINFNKITSKSLFVEWWRKITKKNIQNERIQQK